MILVNGEGAGIAAPVAGIQDDGGFRQGGGAFQVTRVLDLPTSDPAKVVLTVAHVVPVIFFT